MTWSFPYSPKQIKTFVAVLFTFCASVGGTVWGMLEFMVDPMVEARFEQLQDEKEEAERSKKSRWEITGELIGVSGDRMPYRLFEMSLAIDSITAGLSTFEKIYRPVLDKEMRENRLGLFMDENGEEWWQARDGRAYRVAGYEDGRGWFIYHGAKRYIFN